jgi:hypothetical protein
MFNPPPQSIYIFASWNIFTASFLGPPVWSSISLEGNFHPPNNESKKLKGVLFLLGQQTNQQSTWINDHDGNGGIIKTKTKFQQST